MSDLMQQARELLAAEFAKDWQRGNCRLIAEAILAGDDLRGYGVPYALAAIAAALRAAPECAWTYDTSTDSWDSACGEKWQFNDGGPAENNCRFCQGCGGRVAARPQEASDEQE